MALKRIEVDGKEFEISYDIVRGDKKNVIFLHGWGANKEAMKGFAKYLDATQLYIDLPGFGKSSNNFVLNSFDYAKIVDKIINELGFKKEVIVGHSFGGKIALLLNPDKVVLIASAGISMPKPLSVRLKIKSFKLLKSLGLSKFRDFFVSADVKNMPQNMYETFKNVVDEDFRDIFATFKNEAVILGAKNDSAVPLEAVKIQGKLLKKEPIIFEGDHFFYLNYLKEISKVI